ncbi:uncharacterized protein P884DRAFT_57364 [Thermothelomyces heterothallicus CBS 202.75]|uniref:uncharacterized protein n=1 Tax=Thermothelomyces heterothallicus CBS 202.75 TaxID=1149848 RepID=UPI003742B65F
MGTRRNWFSTLAARALPDSAPPYYSTFRGLSSTASPTLFSYMHHHYHHHQNTHTSSTKFNLHFPFYFSRFDLSSLVLAVWCLLLWSGWSREEHGAFFFYQLMLVLQAHRAWRFFLTLQDLVVFPPLPRPFPLPLDGFIPGAGKRAERVNYWVEGRGNSGFVFPDRWVYPFESLRSFSQEIVLPGGDTNQQLGETSPPGSELMWGDS